MTKVIEVALERDLYTDAAIVNAAKFVRVPLMSGKSIKGIFPPDVSVVVVSKGRPGDFFLAGPMIVISSRFHGALCNAGADIELLPVQVTQSTSKFEVGEFSCLNILSSLDRVDRGASVFYEKNGFMLNFTRLSLAPLDSVEPPIYFLSWTIPRIICVRDDLAQCIESFKGVCLSAPEEWRKQS